MSWEKSKKSKINGIVCEQFYCITFKLVTQLFINPLNKWMFMQLILFLSLENYRVTMLEGPWRGHFSLIWKKFVCC